MLLNYAQAFTIIAADLEKLRAQVLIMAAQQNLNLIAVDNPKLLEFVDRVQALLATCQQVPELSRMNGPIGRMLAMLADPVDPNVLHHKLDEMQLQLFDELNLLKLYLVPSWLADLYDNPQPFGEAVFDAFPSAILDSQNAAKCLALGQPTASMFHLMRVMERGLTAYAANLGISYAPSWEAYIRQLNKEFDVEFDKKSKTWKKIEPFHKQIMGDIIAIKIAWRNPTIHIVNDYDENEATRSFAAVQGFMQRLATRIKEPRKRARG